METCCGQHSLGRHRDRERRIMSETEDSEFTSGMNNFYFPQLMFIYCLAATRAKTSNRTWSSSAFDPLCLSSSFYASLPSGPCLLQRTGFLLEFILCLGLFPVCPLATSGSEFMPEKNLRPYELQHLPPSDFVASQWHKQLYLGNQSSPFSLDAEAVRLWFSAISSQ